jgi:hypothetical protein
MRPLVAVLAASVYAAISILKTYSSVASYESTYRERWYNQELRESPGNDQARSSAIAYRVAKAPSRIILFVDKVPETNSPGPVLTFGRQMEVGYDKHLEKKHDTRHNADGRSQKGCVPAYTWHYDNRPSCNVVHEIDMIPDGVNVVAHGGFRDVWRVETISHKDSMINNGDLHQRQKNNSTRLSKPERLLPLALKTLKYWKDHDARNFDRHRRDAIAYDRTTWSPHVSNVYSFCGNSGIFDFASEGSLYDAIGRAGRWVKEQDHHDGHGRINITRQDTPYLNRFEAAQAVAAGLADTHESEQNDNNPPVIVHSDLTAEQVIYHEGQWKVNDFNCARFLQVKKGTDMLSKHRNESDICNYNVTNNPGRVSLSNMPFASGVSYLSSGDSRVNKY